MDSNDEAGPGPFWPGGFSGERPGGGARVPARPIGQPGGSPLGPSIGGLFGNFGGAFAPPFRHPAQGVFGAIFGSVVPTGGSPIGGPRPSPSDDIGAQLGEVIPVRSEEPRPNPREPKEPEGGS